MDARAEVTSVSGKREDWVSISRGPEGPRNIVFNTNKPSSSPKVDIQFYFLEVKFRENEAKIQLKQSCAVSIERNKTMFGFMKRNERSVVAEVVVLYNVFLTGSKLEIQEFRECWVADKKFPENGISGFTSEDILRSATSEHIPESKFRNLDENLKVLLDLVKGVSIGRNG
jgi:hypothetical protein